MIQKILPRFKRVHCPDKNCGFHKFEKGRSSSTCPNLNVAICGVARESASLIYTCISVVYDDVVITGKEYMLASSLKIHRVEWAWSVLKVSETVMSYVR